MQRGWKYQVLLGFGCFASLVACNSEEEQLDEELIITPIRDGKVAAAFTFTTVLKDASLRDPVTLDSDDECNANISRVESSVY